MRAWARISGHLLADRGLSTASPASTLVLACGLVLAGVGCGHPATRDECEAIFQRTVELELRDQSITDPKLVAERTATVRTARGEDLINRCIGRRITDQAVACVKQAGNADEVDRCLR
ncbi:hypothetical protein [Chondromyces apiculatus]|uniref:Lipoprotein n=1 Tax=Chondromyces apiculatus DSM 436 TaxID=1192034 RepID=A0A017T5E9_9BACT|nr:hypothetical protein [Chondromyces apiculatus]EYF04227.1 Hypothetical protein CAP_4704 [Chondromyces apiculatus DSM 436]